MLSNGTLYWAMQMLMPNMPTNSNAGDKQWIKWKKLKFPNIQQMWHQDESINSMFVDNFHSKDVFCDENWVEKIPIEPIFAITTQNIPNKTYLDDKKKQYPCTTLIWCQQLPFMELCF